jgi:hypothetical protein
MAIIEETKQEIKGFLYEESKIQQVYTILNTIPVIGVNQIKSMILVLDILSSPIPFNKQNDLSADH